MTIPQGPVESIYNIAEGMADSPVRSANVYLVSLARHEVYESLIGMNWPLGV